MESDLMKSRLSEIKDKNVESEVPYKYFSYKLARPVICTINFRGFITQGDLKAKVVPVKCGEGHKFTQEGVIRVTPGFDPLKGATFNKVKTKYREATKQDFEQAALKARVKVYFRGFPLYTASEEITGYFSRYGQIEYIYLMGPTKSNSTQRSAQGYVIFSSNESAYKVLNEVKSLYYGGIKLFCEMYVTRKKKKSPNKAENHKASPNYEGQDGSATLPDSVPVSKSKDRSERLLAFASSNTDGKPKIGSVLAVKTGEKGVEHQPLVRSSRPYLKHVLLVKKNSSQQENIRFNVCLNLADRVPIRATE